jgi:Tfp pilus assembly PilM family ATPase/Tfp pilus assembly protein PilN
MNFKSKTIIEISDSYIKILQAQGMDGNLINFVGMLKIQNLTDAAVIQNLRETFKSKDFKPNQTKVILVIPRPYAILRYLDLPSYDRDELRTMVQLQAVNHLPYTKDEVVVDFLPIHKNSEGYTKVLVVAVPLETITRFERILETVSLPPHKITINFIGQWHWYKKHYPSYKDVTVLLDIDTKNSEISFMDHERIFISRATALGIKEIDGQAYDEFIKQLDLTMASYVKEQLGPPIKNIAILSNMNSAEGLKDQMQKYYSLPVQVQATLQDVPVRKNFKWPPLLLSELSALTSMLGLLRVSQDPEIDLTPASVKLDRARLATKKQGLRLGVLGLLALVGVALCLGVNFFKENSYLNDLEQKLRESQKQVNQIKQTKNKLDALKAAFHERVVVSDLIGELYKVMPKSLILTNLALSEGSNLSLQGYTDKASDVNALQKFLIDSFYFTNVNLDYVNKRVTLDGELNYFKISAGIKGKGAKE